MRILRARRWLSYWLLRAELVAGWRESVPIVCQILALQNLNTYPQLIVSLLALVIPKRLV